MEQGYPGIEEKSSKISLGTPLGVKNVILAKMQYLPYDFHIFRGSEGRKINQNPTEFKKKTSANASNQKNVFR